VEIIYNCEMKNAVISVKSPNGLIPPRPLFFLAVVLLAGLFRIRVTLSSKSLKNELRKQEISLDDKNTIYISRPNHHTVAAVALVTIKPDRKTLIFSCRYIFIYSLSRLKKMFRHSKIAHKSYRVIKRLSSRKVESLNNEKVESSNNESNQSTNPAIKYMISEWNNFRIHEVEELPNELLLTSLTSLIGENYPGPKGIHIALLNRCNLECVMCPYHSPKYRAEQTSGYFDKTRQMSEEIFTKILQDAISLGSSLQFGQIEEALIHPMAIEWMKRAKRSGIHVHLTTNGTLLSGKKLEDLANAEIDSLMFSLDAASPEVYRQIRGEDLSRIESNIKNFLAFVEKQQLKKPKIWVSFIMQDQSANERSTFLNKWEKLGADNITYYELSDIDPKTGRVIRKEFTYDRRERYTCSSPWEQCVIYPEGEVSLCCQSMLETGWRGVVSMGTLAEKSLREIWAGKVYNELRVRLIKNELIVDEVCAGCDLWSSGSYFIEENALFKRIYNETSDTYQIKRRLVPHI